MRGNPTLIEVMSYMPPAMGSDKLLLERQNTNDLAKAIAKSHQDNLKYAKKIAFLFRGDDDQETARNIFNFIKKYIPYDIEPGERQCTKTLPRMLDDARNGIGSDCKMYSVFTGTILKCLKIPFKYRLAGYNTSYPQHIYCVTDKYTIDAVLPYFNYEKKPYKYKKDMALYNLSGVDQIGKWTPKTEFGKKLRKATDKIQQAGENVKKVVKDAAKDVVQGYKMVGAAIPRQAFLGLTSLNALGWANRLDRLRKKNPEAIVKFWEKIFGGQMSALNAAIDDGIKKKPLLKKSKVNGVDQIGVVDPFTAAAGLITAAAPIIVAAINAMKSNGISDVDLPPLDVPPTDGTVVDTSKEGENTPLQPISEEKADQVAEKIANAETKGMTPGVSPAPSESTPSTGSKINPMLLVGGAAVLLFLLTKKK